MEIIKFIDSKNISSYCASLIAATISKNNYSVLGLATGSTPLETYKVLIEQYNRKNLDFSKVTTFNLDEYCGLSVENEQSFAYYMKRYLFDHINIKHTNTHIFNGKAVDSSLECERYEDLILSKGGIDILLLGIGTNGHIAFNEPAESFPVKSHLVKLTRETIQANSRFFKSSNEVPHHAYTMGVGTIFSAKKILLLATGKIKAKAIRNTILGPVTPLCPASLLQLHKNITVLLDTSAASEIDKYKGVEIIDFTFEYKNIS